MREDYREFEPGIKDRVILLCALAAGFAALGLLFYDSPITAVLALLAYFPGKRLYARHMAEKRRKRIRDEFKDVLYSYSASLAAGRNLAEAGNEASRALKALYGDGSVLAAELNAISEGMTRTAMGETEGWMDLAGRSGLEEIRDFAQVFAACRIAGGNSVRAVDRAARMIGEKITAENEIRSITSQKKGEGRIIAVMPIAMLLFLRLVSPGYLGPLYGTAAGRVVMTCAIAAMIWSLWMSEKLCRIEV